MKPVVRTFKSENRLADAIDLPGGVRMSDAIAQAEAVVESMRETAMDGLDAKIAKIDALSARGASESGAIYALANEILNEAGIYGLTELSEAGRSLCDLTHAWESGVAPDERAVRVHVEAMKSLRRPDVNGNEAIRAAVLAGLRAVTAKAAGKA